MKKNTILMIGIAVVLMAGAAGFLAYRFLNPANTGVLSVKLPDLAGKQHPLSEWKGKVLIINFWATWCPPCLAEMPELVALQKQYADKNVQIIGIAVDEKTAVQTYNAKANINYPLLIAGDAGLEISKAWGNSISSVPFTVVVNQQGQIVYRQQGQESDERNILIKVIELLLAKP